jgi:hypothetical protein
VQGPATQGSPNVIINGKPGVRVGDQGIHGLCCGLNRWAAAGGAPSVSINSQPAVRLHDRTMHCGGVGKIIEASSNVIIGNGQGRLFQNAEATNAPFVEDVAANQERDQKLLQQNMEYHADNAPSAIQRGKSYLKSYLDERGVENYSKGHYVASYIDAIGSTMLDDIPETVGGAAVSFGIDVAGGKALKIAGKGVSLGWKKADHFIGKLKGKRIRLEGVKTKKVSYTKRKPEKAAKLRRQFDSTERKKFLKAIADSPEKVEQLKEAGFSELDIKKIKAGKVPGKRGEWSVHHKLPLDDGGDNSFDNLVLIKNDPYHKAITNEQLALVKDLSPGETKVIDWPIPEGPIYPVGK